MPRFSRLDNKLYVSRQLREEDFAQLVALGIKSIIINRPDGEGNGEGDDQLSSLQIEKLAAQHNLHFSYQPVMPSQAGDDEAVARFTQFQESLPGPILAYCKTGTRSALLWAQNKVGEKDVDEILTIAKQAGYDLSSVRELLDERAQANIQSDVASPIAA